jgi:integrase
MRKPKMIVTIEVRSGILRLRWDDGKRRSLSLGLRDSPAARSMVKTTKQAIEQDWKLGQYEPTLFKYRPQAIGSNAVDITAPELVARFCKHKLKTGDICHNTAAHRYRAAEKILERMLNKPVSEVDRQCAEALADHLLAAVKPQTGRSAIQTFRAAWECAEGQYAVAKENLWDKRSERFKGQESKPVEPFTRSEVKKIISGFESSDPHYAPFVRFLFGTGARIGEAHTPCPPLRKMEAGAEKGCYRIPQTI